jgi:hypothetical protein
VRVGRRSTGPVRFARFVRGGSLLQIFCLILSFASNKRRCNELRCRAVATAADDGQRLPAEAVTDLQSHEQLDDLPSHAFWSSTLSGFLYIGTISMELVGALAPRTQGGGLWI